MITVIPANLVDNLWHTVSPMLQKALDEANGTYSLEDVKEALEDGSDILLVAMNDAEIVAAGTLQIIKYPQKKVLNMFLAGGKKLKEWEEEVVDTVYNIAKEQGADSIYLQGRDGWVRTLNKYGYKKIGTIVERTVQC